MSSGLLNSAAERVTAATRRDTFANVRRLPMKLIEIGRSSGEEGRWT